MASLNWTSQAASDLLNIADFIAKDSKRYAKVTVNRIRTATSHLKEFPNSVRIVPEVGLDSIRELIIGNYRVIYLIASKDRIDILLVHHSAKRLDKESLSKRAR